MKPFIKKNIFVASILIEIVTTIGILGAFVLAIFDALNFK